MSDETYRRAAAASGIGMWEWNLVTGDTFVDPVLKERLGYERDDFLNNFEEWSQLTHPDDAGPALARVQAHLDGITPLYEADYRVRHRDGSYRWFHARGSVSRDEHGRPVTLSGSSIDITER